MSDKAPDFDIHLNGVPIPDDWHRHLNVLLLEEDIKDTAKFEFHIVDYEGFSVGIDDLKLGTDVSLFMGYVGDPKELMFNGEIESVNPQFDGETASLSIICLDRSYLFKRIPDPTLYSGEKFNNLYEIAKHIVEKHGLKLIVAPSLETEKKDKKGFLETAGEIVIDVVNSLTKYVLGDDQGIDQKKDTDWQVLDEMARTNNYRLLCRGKTVYMVQDSYLRELQKIGLIFEQRPNPEDYKLGIVTPILELNLEMGSHGQREEVQVINWEAHKGTEEEVTSDKPKIDGSAGYTDIKIKTGTIETIRVYGVLVPSNGKQQAKMLATAEMQRRADNLVTGDCLAIGDNRVRVGDMHIYRVNDLKEIGAKYSGDYYVTGTVHELSEKGYTTRMKIRRPGISK